MVNHSFLFLLVIGAILSGCVSKGSDISGTYSHILTEKYTNKQVNESIQFFNDGTWLYQKTGDYNSGVYTVHDKEILLTGQLVAFNLTIQEDGSLKGSEPEPWVKKT